MQDKHMMDGMPMSDKEMAKKKKKMMKRNGYSKETVVMAKGMMNR